MLRRQDGQIIPALVVVMLALLAFGMLFFQVGRAAIFSTEAQTAADAAALAAAKDVQQQLMEQVAPTGTSNLALINPCACAPPPRATRSATAATSPSSTAAASTSRSGSSPTSELGRGAERARPARTRAARPMRAPGRADRDPGARRRRQHRRQRSAAAIRRSPRRSGRSSARRSATGRRRAARARPPTTWSSSGTCCASTASPSPRTPRWATTRRPACTPSTGYHYQCRNSAALDVNHDQFNEAGVIDAIVAPLHELGFRTIWRAAGHFDHIHIDVANSGPIGAGCGLGGAVGALEETMLERQADRLGRGLPAVRRLRLAGRRRLLRRPARPGHRARHLPCARPLQRVAEGPAGRVRGGDRRVRRAQPQLRRPRLARRLPAAPVVKAWGTAAQIMNPEHAAMMFITNAIRTNGVPERRPARAGRAGLRLPRPLRPGRPAGVRAADQVLLMRRGRLLLCARGSAPGCGVLDDEGPALSQGPDPNVYGPPRGGAPRAPRDRRSRGCSRPPSGGRARARGGRDRRGRDDGRDRRAPEGARHRRRRPDRVADVVALGRRRRRRRRRDALRECQPTCAAGRTDRSRPRSRSPASESAAAGATSRPPRSACPGPPRAARDLRPSALLTAARARAMTAHRARRAGDQLTAPAAGPRVDRLHQLLREPVGVGRADDRLDELARPPVGRAAGRRLDAHQRQRAELRR